MTTHRVTTAAALTTALLAAIDGDLIVISGGIPTFKAKGSVAMSLARTTSNGGYAAAKSRTKPTRVGSQ